MSAEVGSPESPQHVTQPVLVQPGALIENVYNDQNGEADHTSQRRFAAYLISRIHGPDAPATQEMVETGTTTRTIREQNGWWITKRQAFFGTILATATLNACINTQPLTQKIVDAIGGAFALPHIPEAPTSAPQPGVIRLPETIASVTVRIPGAEQGVGKVGNASETVTELVASIEKGLPDGRKADRVAIEASASDEWFGRGDLSLGTADPQNAELADRRGSRVMKAVKRRLHLHKTKSPKMSVESYESILDHLDLGELEKTAHRNDVTKVTDAIATAEHGGKVPTSLRRVIESVINARRTVTANLHYPAKTIPAPPAPKPHAKPEHHKKKHKLPFGFIPFPIPFKRRFKKTKVELLDREVELKKEVPDKVFVELYQEALKSNNELVDNAWVWTRKYQALLREERITQITQYTYKDAHGKTQEFKLGFVDHVPTDETMEMIEDMMKKISLLRDGDVPERLDMIMIFPSSNAGKRKPKSIGLGIDEQYDSNIRGIAIPDLNLVEMHMPKKPSAKQVKGFKSAAWTLAHEVAGHFTDVVNRPVRLRYAANERGLRNYVTVSRTWLDAGGASFAMVGKRGSIGRNNMQFSIPNVRDSDHPSQTDEYIVNTGNPLLRQASFVRLQRVAPTQYSETNAAEVHAEVAAHALTEDLIPFSEIGLSRHDFGAPGYHIDAGLMHQFARWVGSGLNHDLLTWDPKDVERIAESWTAASLGVNQLSTTHRQSEQAKNSPYQRDEDRIRILSEAAE